MKLKLTAAISALAIPALAHAQQSGPQPNVPKPTTADAQNVVRIVTSCVTSRPPIKKHQTVMIITGVASDWEYLSPQANQSLKSAFSGGNHD